MTIEIKYICLREEFLSVAKFYISASILSMLKDYYAQDINSNRKLSQIQDIRTLVTVLEKRDILSYTNVDPLIYISNNYLNDICLQNKIKDYKVSLHSIQYIPFYNRYLGSSGNIDENKSTINELKSDVLQLKILSESKNRSTLSTTINHETNVSQQEQMLQQLLLSHISERIGHSWRDTVRYLGVPEYEIDAIQNKHALNLKEQSYNALKLYISHYSNDNWKINLLHALQQARRRDLKELAEEIMVGCHR